MPFASVKIQPGVDVITTPTDSQAGINLCNLIRWKEGLPEKIGGWVRFYPFSLNSIPRELHPWQDLNGNQRLAVGCTQSLNVITNGANQVITPQTTTTNTAPDFTTTTSSVTVTIIDSNLPGAPTINNFVWIETPVSIDGILVSGVYPISSVISSTSYTILSATAATAAVAHGGAVPIYATTTSSPIVTVTLPNHPYAAGDSYYASVSTTVGGVAVAGSYLVQSASTATFTINAALPATSASTGSMNGGNARFEYFVTVGPQPSTAGYGVGAYGSGGYGTGTAPASGQGTPITATDWAIDNWGEILLANPEGGPIYQWGPESGFQTAQLVSTGPLVSTSIFVTMPQQILVALGASFDGSPNPLQIAWTDAGDFTDWTDTSSNFAGSYLIPRGSKIVGGLQASTQNLIWTDLGLWSMQYVNLPNVYGFTEIMSGCGLVGSHAAVLAEGTVFWMSQQQFFYMTGGGGPKPLSCTVWDVVFQNISTDNAWKVRAGANSAFNEIWWHYPSANGSGENDSYVKFDTVNGVWDYGTLPTGRSAWIDQSILGPPIGGDPTGLIFQHEMGYNGDGAALNPFFETGYWVIGEGENFAFMDQMLPDFTYKTYSGTATASPLITISAVDYPNGTVKTYGPYTVDSSTNKIDTRVRGRQVAIRVESQDLNSWWRLGLVRSRVQPQGRR